jgi:hypothetical protein
VHAADEVSQGKFGVRVGVRRIERDRLFEQAFRAVPRIWGELGKVRAPPQK